MSNLRVIKIEKAEIYPQNSMATYSFRDGSPIIEFLLTPVQNKLIDPTTIRLNFTVKCGYGSGTDYRYVNNQQGYGDFNATTGDSTGSFNNRVGVVSIIDSLKISTIQNQVIEEVRNYSRLNATLIPVQNSFSKYKNVIPHKYQSYGNRFAQGIRNNSPMSCSMNLRAGLINTTTPLNVNSYGGIKLSINLSPDSFVFNCNDEYNGVSNANPTNSGAGKVYYQIIDPTITFNYMVMNQPLPITQVDLKYPAYNSFQQVVHSSDNQSTLNLNLQSVRTSFQNFIPSSFINNQLQDSLGTLKMRNSNGGVYNEKVNIQEVSHLRNGLKYPKQFSTDERAVILFGGNETHLLREFITAVKSIELIKSSLLSCGTQKVGQRGIEISEYNQADKEESNGEIFGIGNRYDNLSIGSGAEFKNSSYSVRIVSDLDGNSPNSTFTFTLSNQGLMVNGMNVNSIM